MEERVIPWGTVIAGTIAVGTAAVIGLVHVGGWTVPFQTAGPGAVIVVGILIVLAGLLAVLRSSRRTAVREASSRAPGPSRSPYPAQPSSPGPSPNVGQSSSPAPPSDPAQPPAAGGAPAQSPPAAPGGSQPNPEPDPAAQGAAEDLSAERSDADAAQRNH